MTRGPDSPRPPPVERLGPSLLVSAVEASADLHGAAVVRELRALHPGLRVFGAGGPHLRALGCETLVRAEELSVMGLVEVLPAIPRILRALGTLRRAARERAPVAALLIDSPDFNLRLAKRLRKLGVPVGYFIGPSVWAWRTSRVKQIARDVDRMLVILPFEQDFYARHGVHAVYVGNPLADELRALPPAGRGGRDRGALRASLDLDPARPVLALLPGSRRQEIARLWRPLLDAARLLLGDIPELQLCVPVAPTLPRALLEQECAGLPVTFVEGRAPDVLAACDAAAVASGTATLEAALEGAPTVVVYRLSWLSWAIARLLVRVRFVSLVNLLESRRVVPELLQASCTPEAIADALLPLLRGGNERQEQRAAFDVIRAKLAPPGSPGAARRAAEELSRLLEGA